MPGVRLVVTRLGAPTAAAGAEERSPRVFLSGTLRTEAIRRKDR